MTRPLALSLNTLGVLACALGLLLGGRIGRPLERAKAPLAPRRSVPASHRLTNTEEDQRLLLGIAVPFREVYRALAHRTSDEIAALGEKLASLPPGPAKEQRILSFFKAWATLDSHAAFAGVGKLPRRLRENAFEAVVDGADANAAGSLVASINDLPEGSVSAKERTGLLSQAIGKWSRVDPPAAARALEANKTAGMSFFSAWNDVATNWAAIDPAAAIAWAREKSPPGSNFALSGAVTGWWDNDPRAAEAYVASNLANLEDRQLAGTLAANIFRDAPERALQWVSQLPNEEARRQADSSIAISWSFRDPAAAAQWTASLPAAEQVESIALVMGIWAGADPVAAAKWLGQYDGAGRDRAVQDFSFNVGTKDPVGALTWAATIFDPKIRATAEQQLTGEWLKRSPQAATTWIQNSSLPAEEKARLLQPSPGP